MPPKFYMRLFRNLVLRRNGHIRMSCRPWSRAQGMGLRRSGKAPRVLLKRTFPWMIDLGFKSMQGTYMTPYGFDKPIKPSSLKKGTYRGPGLPSKRTNRLYGYVGTAVFKDKKGRRKAERTRQKITGL